MPLVKIRLVEPESGFAYVRLEKVNAILSLTPVNARALKGSQLPKPPPACRAAVGPLCVDLAIAPADLAARVAACTGGRVEDLTGLATPGLH